MNPGRRWIAARIRNERRALERARRKFLRDPGEESLHDVRTTGRRLRSLLEDVRDLVARPRLLRKVKAAARVTDAARDAAILMTLLESSVDPGERDIAGPLFDELARRRRSATKAARRALRAVRFA
ncbi:MAG TPA: CHAD domain-containing protein [Candidatus Acidoferrales bacterium]|nr:CHAD domain-containing protein [Candidatus Acidoferrales bacterium]